MTHPLKFLFRAILVLQALILPGCERLDVYQKTADLAFPDAALTRCVHETGKSRGWTQAGRFTSLRCNNAQGSVSEGNAIEKIDGIGVLKELVLLDLSFNEIRNAEPVATLPRLRELDLGHNRIASIPLRSRSILQSLNLDYNHVEKLNWLGHFEDLARLTLSHNQIKDLTPVAKLKHLESLDLSSNRIEDMAALRNLRNLKELSLARNSLSSITQLGNLEKLEILDLSHNNLQEVQSLAPLTGLIELDLSGNPITNLAPIAELINLESLSLDATQVKDLHALYSLGRLEKISLRNLPSTSCPQIQELEEIFGKDALTIDRPCVNTAATPPLTILTDPPG